MKKSFSQPEMEVVLLTVQDVITASWVPGENETEGDEL